MRLSSTRGFSRRLVNDVGGERSGDDDVGFRPALLHMCCLNLYAGDGAVLVDEPTLDKSSCDDGGVEYQEPMSLATQTFALGRG